MKNYCFYLPQFHSCKGNDLFWGEGFTDWDTTKVSKPLYNGHLQPRLPLSGEFYNLLENNVIEEQCRQAKSVGIDAFAVYYYFFDENNRALEKPLEVFNHRSLETNFFICWVNGDWTKSWVGEDKTVIYKQQYDDNLYDAVISDALLSFESKNYEFIDGRPVFYVHYPNSLPDNIFFQRFRARAKVRGFDPIFIAPHIHSSKSISREIDYFVGLPPGDIDVGRAAKIPFVTKLLFKYKIGAPRGLLFELFRVIPAKSFAKLAIDVIHSMKVMPNYIPCILVSWDNSPRYRLRSMVLEDFSVSELLQYFSTVVELSDGKPFIFWKSWNEWAEGNSIEPNDVTGDMIFNCVKRVIDGHRDGNSDV